MAPTLHEKFFWQISGAYFGGYFSCSDFTMFSAGQKIGKKRHRLYLRSFFGKSQVHTFGDILAAMFYDVCDRAENFEKKCADFTREVFFANFRCVLWNIFVAVHYDIYGSR